MELSLNADRFERFQVYILSNKTRAKKCRLCSFGDVYSPLYKDPNCHTCGVKWEESLKG
jgi:hypothetical protein